jgi:hypothetical protein
VRHIELTLADLHQRVAALGPEPLLAQEAS